MYNDSFPQTRKNNKCKKIINNLSAQNIIADKHLHFHAKDNINVYIFMQKIILLFQKKLLDKTKECI